MALNSRKSLFDRIRRGKSARQQLVDSHLAKTIAYQIRATRDRLMWSQERLAQEVGMNQNAISRLESPGYGKPTLTTLKRVAAALDVALVVRLAPFSEFVDWISGTPRVIAGLSTEALAVPSFDAEAEREDFLIEPVSAATAATMTATSQQSADSRRALAVTFQTAATASTLTRTNYYASAQRHARQVGMAVRHDGNEPRGLGPIAYRGSPE